LNALSDFPLIMTQLRRFDGCSNQCCSAYNGSYKTLPKGTQAVGALCALQRSDDADSIGRLCRGSSVRANRIVISSPGPSSVLRYEQHDIAAPAPHEVLIRQTAIGLNYIDIQHRTGRYTLPHYPSPIGIEGAGTIEAIGGEVQTFKPGDRVVYSSMPIGAYADLRLMPADRLVPVPSTIPDRLAAGIFTKGITAHYLIFTTFPVKSGDVILVHAAAGGVGLILCQWAKYLGATVIGTVGTEQKAEIARAHGCDATIVYTKEDFVGAVKRLTQRNGVAAVFDSVGKDTFERSLHCLAPRGLLVSFGTASGPIAPFDIFELNRLDSLYVTSPAFVTHTRNRNELLRHADALFGAIAAGVVKMSVGRTYPLAEAAQAHEDLQARRTCGVSIFVP
jgi:NADPH:quinone reductase